MPYYRKKPVVIEAIQYTGKESVNTMTKQWGEAFCNAAEFDEVVGLFICTLEGDMEATLKDYIIKGLENEFYPCKENIFDKSYELAFPNGQSGAV